MTRLGARRRLFQTSRRASLTVCLASGILVQGCVAWPVYKTVQLGQGFKIVDERGAPVPDASVTWMSGAHPYGSEVSRETARSDREGRVRFRSIREWQAESLMIHGSRSYFWDWCVAAAGFGTVRSSDSLRSASEEIVVRMSRGDTKPCPSPDGSDR